MSRRCLRAYALAAVTCLVATLSVALTQAPAYAVITNLTYNASAAVNTNTAFAITATSDKNHVQGATLANLVGPNGVDGQPQMITGTGVTVTGSTVSATFNLDAGGVPANPGSWRLRICDVSCAADALGGVENSAQFTILGTSAVITGFQPGQRGQ